MIYSILVSIRSKISLKSQNLVVNLKSSDRLDEIISFRVRIFTMTLHHLTMAHRLSYMYKGEPIGSTCYVIVTAANLTPVST